MRRNFLKSLAAMAASGIAGRLAWAESTWPEHPIRIIVPYPPGGSVDPVIRVLAAKLGELLGQTIVIDNRAGGNTAIGAGMVARAAADGYTLLFTAASTHVIHTMQAKLPYDSIKDFAPVAAASRSSYVLAVHPSVPARTLPEFIAYAKAHPGKLNFGSSGVGNLNHLAGELFNQRTGTKIQHVPYKGGAAALQDLVGGRVQMMISNVPVLQPQVDAGALRALAYTSTHPGSAPLPTFAQYGLPEFESVESVNVLLAPARMPEPIVAKVSAAMQKSLAAPEVASALETQMVSPFYLTPQQLGQRMLSDRARFAEVIERGHIVLAP